MMPVLIAVSRRSSLSSAGHELSQDMLQRHTCQCTLTDQLSSCSSGFKKTVFSMLYLCNVADWLHCQFQPTMPALSGALCACHGRTAALDQAACTSNAHQKVRGQHVLGGAL